MQTPEVEETSVGAHVLLITPDKKVILQQRDKNPNISNSGLISMFGGTLKRSEDLVEGLKRELLEELELNVDLNSIEKLNTYQKTKELDGVEWEINVFVIRNITPQDLKLHEGQGFKVGTPLELIQDGKLTRITKLALEDIQKLSEK